MIWLVLGVLLWALAHLFKRLAPAVRRGMGDSAKGLVAAASLIAIVLMVIGYRLADTATLYSLPSWAFHLNNTLMLIAVGLIWLGQSKSRLRGAMRHPMLTGAVVWAIAHLLVNGDVASLVLFGGLGLWAIVEMVAINRAEPKWKRPAPGNAKGDAIFVVGTLVVYAVIIGIHMLIGPSPIPGMAG